MIKPRLVLPLLAIIALAVTLAACGSGASTTPGGAGASAPTDTAKIVDGGILRIGYTDPPDGISPFVGSNQVSYIIFQEMYPALVQYDENYQLKGDWAKSWTVSNDNRTYTFSLRPGKWSDGQPLTAADAVWTFQTVQKYAKGATGLMAAYIEGVASVRAIDDLTLEVTFAKPKATALSNLQPFYILPKHIFEQHVGNNGKELLTWDMKAEDTLASSKEYVRQNPVLVVVGALTFGAAIGCMLMMARRQHTTRQRYVDEPLDSAHKAILAALAPVAQRLHEGCDLARDGAGKAMDRVRRFNPGRTVDSLSGKIGRVGSNLNFW